MARFHGFGAPFGPLLAALALLVLPAAAVAAGASRAQERAALEFLVAVASGSPQAVADALHPDELHRLRTGIAARLQADAASGDHTVQRRIFGEASNLADIERLTDANFFAALAGRLRYPARLFTKVDGLEAVRDGDKLAHVVVRGSQPEGRGKTRVVTMVTLLPYGKEWKAAVPSEIEAQIEDLLDGRDAAGGLLPRRVAGAAGAPGAAAAPAATNTPEIRRLLADAARALTAGHCDVYYGEYMSPGFRRVTSASALDTLVRGCERSESLREMLVATLRIVGDSPPQFSQAGARASYDLAGRGLPYDHFVLERLGDRWYIAE
ncbi:MAG: hypothetical protein KIT37_11820 [Steroidobacteraceae bacterium]|nr:hypothetical protein [Steroidobacteraceae bacterium]